MEQLRIPRLEDYEPYIGAPAVERILQKAERLRGFHVVHVNSTRTWSSFTILSPCR